MSDLWTKYRIVPGPWHFKKTQYGYSILGPDGQVIVRSLGGVIREPEARAIVLLPDLLLGTEQVLERLEGPLLFEDFSVHLQKVLLEIQHGEEQRAY